MPLAMRDLQTFVLEEQRSAWQRMMRLPRAFEAAREVRVGTTPHDVVFEAQSMRLLRYRRESPGRYAEPVLFCYALVNRPYILDLQPNRSVVEHYLARGFDVYLLDWGAPAATETELGLEGYVCRRLRRVVEYVLSRARARQLHLVGYCMGGTLSTLLTALHPELVRTLTLLATPIDFSVTDSLLNVWTTPEHFDVDAFIDAHGNCPAWFLQACFLQMKPVQNFLEKPLVFYEQMVDPDFVANYVAMERWVNDNVPVAGKTFRQFVKLLYQENRLVEGSLLLGDERVDLRRITCPLLVLTASADHLVPPASSEGIRPHVGSRDVTSLSVDAGHVGLVVSSKARKKLWPEATRWLAERSVPSTTSSSSVAPSATSSASTSSGLSAVLRDFAARVQAEALR